MNGRSWLLLAMVVLLCGAGVAFADDTCTVSGNIQTTELNSLDNKVLYCRDSNAGNDTPVSLSAADDGSAGNPYVYTCNGVDAGTVTLEVEGNSAGPCSATCANPPGNMTCYATIDHTVPGGCRNPAVTVSLVPFALLPGMRRRKQRSRGGDQ